MRRSYIYLMTRLTLILLAILIGYLEPQLIIYIIPLSLVLVLPSIYIINNRYIFYSYLIGLLIISFIMYLTIHIYNTGFYDPYYLYVYTTIIPLIITITPAEIITLYKYRSFKPLIYALISIKLLVAYLSNYWKSIETYRALHRDNNKFRIHLLATRSIISSQPYMLTNIMEYLYVLLNSLQSDKE